MTKSRAYELSQEHAKEVARKLWLDKEITTNAVSFLAGMKAMLVELQNYAQEIKDAEFPATREQQIIVDKITRDLGKLMEQDG